ncbi:MAG TPA: tetratricopeptide repeat protein [Bryobacteraceae bacterium]|nr:tetratricopeptide repeat protein [Bryobacteraceae bacterium]
MENTTRETIDVIRQFLLGLAFFAVTPARAADAVQPLDIKPGLWEITLTVRTSGPPPLPPELLAELSPEERTRIDTKAKERAAAGPRTTVKRSCLDDKERQQPFILTFGGEDQGCRQTIVNASRNRQEVRVECGRGLSKGGGTYRIEAIDPENVKVSSDWSATDGSRAMKTSSTATLKWLGEICEVEFATSAPMPAKPNLPDTTIHTPAPAIAPARVPAPVSSPPAQSSAKPAAKPASADAGYYYRLGREQAGRNDFEEALQSLNRAIELDARQAIAYNARGYVYLRQKNFAGALADFSEAIRLRPDYTNAYQNRAIARHRLGDEQGTAEDNRKAAELASRPNGSR